MTIRQVIDNGYCIGCGVCKLDYEENIDIKLNEKGFYSIENQNVSNSPIASAICPFSSDSLNENELAKKSFEHNLSHKDEVGYYKGIYAGYINDANKRKNSSSGGLTTWFISCLFRMNLIDGVIHVGPSEEDETVFEYKVSESLAELELKENKKSRYYPVSLSKIINKIDSDGKKYVFIGTPCFVKAVRLAQNQNYLKNVIYCVSLLCGHMKSAAFAENYAWQVGIKPVDLKFIDFRVKNQTANANKYAVEIVSNQERKIIIENSKLFGSNWGHGFFKHKSCDFCDDIAGELADITFGDAWLPKYIADSMGTNIVITRNVIFEKIMQEYADDVTLEQLTVKDFYDSQAGNFRHRREGLRTRINYEKSWTPVKRLNLSLEEVSLEKKEIYIRRYNLSKRSNELFLEAKRRNKYFYFKIKILPSVLYYEFKSNGISGVFKFMIKLYTPDKVLKKVHEIIKVIRSLKR